MRLLFVLLCCLPVVVVGTAYFKCYRTPDDGSSALEVDDCENMAGCVTHLRRKNGANSNQAYTVEVGCNQKALAADGATCHNHASPSGYSICCEVSLCNRAHELLKGKAMEDIKTAASWLAEQAQKQLDQESRDRLPNPVPYHVEEEWSPELPPQPAAQKQEERTARSGSGARRLLAALIVLLLLIA